MVIGSMGSSTINLGMSVSQEKQQWEREFILLERAVLDNHVYAW
jgi:hypothetical protein